MNTDYYPFIGALIGGLGRLVYQIGPEAFFKGVWASIKVVSLVVFWLIIIISFICLVFSFPLAFIALALIALVFKKSK